MEITSKLQVVDIIEDAINDVFSDEVKGVYFERYSDTRKDKTYPQLSYNYAEGSTSNLSTNTFSIEFEFLDLVEGRNDEDDIIKNVGSFLDSISTRFVYYLRNTKGLRIQNDVTYTWVAKKYKDGLGSQSFTLDFTKSNSCV